MSAYYCTESVWQCPKYRTPVVLVTAVSKGRICRDVEISQDNFDFGLLEKCPLFEWLGNL